MRVCKISIQIISKEKMESPVTLRKLLITLQGSAHVHKVLRLKKVSRMLLIMKDIQTVSQLVRAKRKVQQLLHPPHLQGRSDTISGGLHPDTILDLDGIRRQFSLRGVLWSQLSN